MYHQTNKINSEKEIEVRNEEVCNKPIELPKPKLERQIAFNIKDLPATKLWFDFDTESDDEEEEKWDCIDLLNRILCNCKLLSYKKVRPIGQ